MNVSKRDFTLAALCYGIMAGIFLEYGFSNLYLSVAGGIVAFLTLNWFLNWFFDRKRLVDQSALTDLKGQDLLYEDVANHVVNREAVGGKLYLLTNELVFVSHKFNIQRHTQTIDLKQIKEISLYAPQKSVANGLIVTTRDGKQEKYVVTDRTVWKEKIERQIFGGVL